MNERDSKNDIKELVNPNGEIPQYHLMTFGCQMNERDSEMLAGMLQEMGYNRTDIVTEADIILLNTCCVRETAENKILGRIGELKVLKAQNPELIIGICGCMTQQSETAERLKNRAPHIDIIIGTHNLHKLPDLVDQVKKDRKTIIEVWESEGDIVENLPSKRIEGVKAYVSIMYGCNNFCTYCIVPYVRGRERSRKPEDVVREALDLASHGFKEIMLLGQNVNSYGKDLDPKVNFASLLQQMDNIEGLERIRYMTSHPRDFNEELIDVIASSKKVCHQFHLPVQAGGNSVLKKMNRGYTKEEYLVLINKIRDRIPEAGITTDLIVGFPGETEEDFAETLDLLKKVKFDAAFTFVYNKRSGTPAATMEDQVPEKVKKARIQQVIAIQSEISRAGNAAEMDKIHEVLIEGPNKGDDAVMQGRTGTNKLVLVPGGKQLIGQIIKVRIVDFGTWHLNGEIL